MRDLRQSEVDDLYEAAKQMACACVITGGDSAEFTIKHLTHPEAGNFGDWVVVCRKMNWLDRLKARFTK